MGTPSLGKAVAWAIRAAVPLLVQLVPTLAMVTPSRDLMDFMATHVTRPLERLAITLAMSMLLVISMGRQITISL